MYQQAMRYIKSIEVRNVPTVGQICTSMNWDVTAMGHIPTSIVVRYVPTKGQIPTRFVVICTYSRSDTYKHCGETCTYSGSDTYKHCGKICTYKGSETYKHCGEICTYKGSDTYKYWGVVWPPPPCVASVTSCRHELLHTCATSVSPVINTPNVTKHLNIHFFIFLKAIP